MTQLQGTRQDYSVSLPLPHRRDPDAERLVSQVTASGQPPLSEMGVEGARAYLEEKDQR